MTKFKLITYLALPIALIATLFGSLQSVAPLDGQVYAVQPGSTVWGIRAALASKSNTMILAKDQMYLFVWNIRDGWAFAGLNASGRGATEIADDILSGGNFVNIKTMSQLSNMLKANGWQAVAASQVPNVIHSAVATSSNWLTIMSGGLPTFVVVPAGIFVIPDGLMGDEPILQ